MQGIDADELHIEWNHLPLQWMAPDSDFAAAQTAACVLHHRKGFGQDLIQAPLELLFVLDFREFLFPRRGFGAQIVVGNLLKTGFEFVDFSHERAKPFDFALVFRADKFLNDKTYHGRTCQTLRKQMKGVKDIANISVNAGKHKDKEDRE